mmetsp:Transcript_81522/g.264115  ORF Transcript_81522/g.264115 Transcript_81522/m.264115 type:complete len:237 (+) Transcript_81522:191-901(+)
MAPFLGKLSVSKTRSALSSSSACEYPSTTKLARNISTSSLRSMKPLPSSSNIMKANLSFSDLAAVVYLDNMTINSFSSMLPLSSISKTRNIRLETMLFSIPRACMNSFSSIAPLLSASISMNLLYTFLIWDGLILFRPPDSFRTSVSTLSARIFEAWAWAVSAANKLSTCCDAVFVRLAPAPGESSASTSVSGLKRLFAVALLRYFLEAAAGACLARCLSCAGCGGFGGSGSVIIL